MTVECDELGDLGELGKLGEALQVSWQATEKTQQNTTEP